jgi:hypothetical protein
VTKKAGGRMQLETQLGGEVGSGGFCGGGTHKGAVYKQAY